MNMDKGVRARAWFSGVADAPAFSVLPGQRVQGSSRRASPARMPFVHIAGGRHSWVRRPEPGVEHAENRIHQANGRTTLAMKKPMGGGKKRPALKYALRLTSGPAEDRGLHVDGTTWSPPSPAGRENGYRN